MRRIIIFLSLVILALAACNQNSVRITPSLDKQIEQRKTVMLDSAQCTYSNAEKWEVIEAFTHAMEDSAATYQSKIDSVLTGPAREVYIAERKAFSNWYDYQSFVASVVVVEIWQLYIGGTAGGTLYEMHLYDRANANMTEQEIIFNALAKQAYAASYQSSATLEEILEAKDSLVAELMSTYSLIDNEDNWRSLDHTADEVEGFISKDLSLFQEWISARNDFESLVNPDISDLFSSQTGYWLDLYLQTIQGKYIQETY